MALTNCDPVRIKEEATTTSTTEGDGSSFDCNFESSDCGWSPACQDPAFCWERTTYQTCTESHLDCPQPDVLDGEENYVYLDGAQGNGKPMAAQLMSPGGSSASGDCFIFYYIFKVSVSV